MSLESGVPIPKIGENQVLIRLFAAGVNPVDTYIRSGTYARKPNLPYIPGGDGAGIVESVGTKVKKFQKGQRVFTVFNDSGTYAEYSVCNEKEVFLLSPGLNFDQGAAIGVPYFTAYRAVVQKARARPSETILVHGASGAVGIAAIQMARAYGMVVLGTAGTKEGLDIVSKNGAHHVFNHKEAGYTNKIMEATEGQGVDVILEMLSNVNLGKDLNMLTQNGRITVIGCRGDVEINPRLMMQKESSITGVALATSTDSEWKEIGNAIQSGMELGWVRPVIDKVYQLEEAKQAHNDIINSVGARGKLILTIASYC